MSRLYLPKLTEQDISIISFALGAYDMERAKRGEGDLGSVAPIVAKLDAAKKVEFCTCGHPYHRGSICWFSHHGCRCLQSSVFKLGAWQHYKGAIYYVYGITYHTDGPGFTQPLVKYSRTLIPDTGEDPEFSRPLSEWFEKVRTEGSMENRPRFIYLSSLEEMEAIQYDPNLTEAERTEKTVALLKREFGGKF